MRQICGLVLTAAGLLAAATCCLAHLRPHFWVLAGSLTVAGLAVAVYPDPFQD